MGWTPLSIELISERYFFFRSFQALNCCKQKVKETEITPRGCTRSDILCNEVRMLSKIRPPEVTVIDFVRIVCRSYGREMSRLIVDHKDPVAPFSSFWHFYLELSQRVIRIWFVGATLALSAPTSNSLGNANLMFGSTPSDLLWYEYWRDIVFPFGADPGF